MTTLAFRDVHDFLRLQAEADAQASSHRELIENVGDDVPANDIDALREQLRAAVTGAVHSTAELSRCLRSIAKSLA